MTKTSLVEKYGKGCPDDWVERNVYSRSSLAGIFSLLALDVIFFGAIGITIFAIQMMTMPALAATRPAVR